MDISQQQLNTPAHILQRCESLIRQDGRDVYLLAVQAAAISAASTWSRRPCNPSTTRSARGCHLCLRYNLSPMCPGWTSFGLAEGVGFEPTRERKPPGGFQDRCLKPLGHPSKPLNAKAFRSKRDVNETRFATACYPPRVIDREMYKWRHLIENFFCKLKEFKRIAMRADKTDQCFAAIIHLAAAVIASR